jgi:regulator of protease activity HflC (stomatin/prohibitin superfamily)
MLMNVTSLISGVVALFWVLTVAMVAVVVVRAARNQPIRRAGTLILVPALLAIILTVSNAGLVFIPPEDRGVVISAIDPKGYRETALTPGLRWVVPFAEYVVTYPISKQTYTMSATTQEGQIQGDDSIAARTLDGQEIFVDASVIFEINPLRVVEVHIAWQNRYEDGLVRAQSRGIIRDVVSQYRVDEVVSTKRLDMTNQIRDGMSKKLDENGLTLVDFILRNITFSPEYAASVEQKQVAEQEAQRAKFVVESKKQEAEQARQAAQGQADSAVIAAKGAAEARIVNAEAEAKALNLIADALKDKPELLTYQYITKLSPNVTAMFLPSNSPFLFPLPQIGPVQSTDTTTSVLPTPAPTQAPTPAPTPTP